jgi:arylsulfatase A-like enzyme
VGLATGFAEAALQAFKRATVQPITFTSPQIVWMAPVSYLAGFLILGLLVAAVAFPALRGRTFGAALALLTLLAWWSLMMVFKNQLHWAARLALTFGLTVQTVRMVRARAERCVWLARRTLPYLAAAVLAAALLLNTWHGLAERRGLAALPDAPAGSPNVLLVVLDAVRAPNLSLHGYPRRTSPRMEELARRGVSFERAIATAPWTLPSHASLFTGLWPHQMSPDWGTPLDDRPRTLAEALSARGYATGAFVGNFHYASRETGLARGFHRYEDFPVLDAAHLVRASMPGRLAQHFGGRLLRRRGRQTDPGRRTAETVNSRLVRWVERVEGRPFFAFVNYYDAHDPYLPPESFRSRFDASAPDAGSASAGAPDTVSPGHPPGVADEAEARRVRRLLDRYDGAIAHADHALGELLDTLESRGVLANTIVVVTSDHGEEFGEHGVFEHGKSLYMPSLHVPLVVAFPGRVPAGITVRQPASLRDVPSTVMELAGLTSGGAFPGASLSRYWRADSTWSAEPVLAEVGRGFDLPPNAPAGRGPMSSLVTASHHYIRGGDGKEELYDYVADPWELSDLAAGDTSRLAELRRALDAVVRRAEGSPR